MDCRILRHVTLKADGHLGCDDSVGYHIDVGHTSLAPGWSLKHTLNSPIYRHIRSSFAAGRVPWPGTCEGCDLFSGGGVAHDTLDTKIELLVEPTLACNISCACCLRKQIISNGRNTSSMDPEILRRFVASAIADKIEIEQVHYIGWGEPLMHDNFRSLYDIVKKGVPLAHQVVTTAANVDFRSTVGDAALDRIVVSVDGSQQAVYEKYRRGGNFEKTVKFMHDSRIYGHPGTFLEWKYILFEYNDSDKDILRAQEIADEVGVDSLLFIITNSKWHSKRFTVDHSQNLPLYSPIASISPAAAMNAVAFDCQLVPLLSEGFGHIDKCTISVGKFLTVEGWALDTSGAYSSGVELLVDGVVQAKTRTTLRREDVLAAHPHSTGGRSGFMFRVPIDIDALPSRIQVRITGPSGQNTIGGQSNWLFSSPGVKIRADLPSF
jgi:organic radical activating enzyme